MQIELAVSELAKRTNTKILFAIYFNFNRPRLHAVFGNFYEMPRRGAPAVPRRAHTRELLHPAAKRDGVRGCAWSRAAPAAPIFFAVTR